MRGEVDTRFRSAFGSVRAPMVELENRSRFFDFSRGRPGSGHTVAEESSENEYRGC